MSEYYFDEDDQEGYEFNELISSQLHMQNTDNIKKITSDVLKRTNCHIHSDKTIVNSITKMAKNKKTDTDPYYYCDKELMKKVDGLIKTFEKIKSMSEDECCICLDTCDFKERSYFMCKHFVCNSCYDIYELGLMNARCPICRTIIQKFIFSDKYAIICTGIPTKLYTFENGGYKSVWIAYFPEYNGEKSTMFSGITYHDENKNKKEFVQRIDSLLNSGYAVILQNHNEVRRWMNEIMLKDLANDKRLIYE